jgi:putative aldouronate transport system permease protein
MKFIKQTTQQTLQYKKLKKYKSDYVMFSFIILYFVLFSYLPLVKGIILSLQSNNLIGHRSFVFFKNYTSVLKDINYIAAIKNSLIIGIIDCLLYFVLSLFLALVLNEIKIENLKKTIQTIVYIPYLFSWAVIGGIWSLIFDLNGLTNKLIGLFHHTPIFFLAEPNLARPLIIGMGVWRSIGYFSLLFSIAILDIDEQLFDAAKIDGTSRFQQIKYIIIPTLVPTMKTIILLLALGILTHFDEIYVMINSANYSRISTLLYYVYETGIINFKTGIASAGSTLVMIGTVIITLFIRKASKFDED